MFSSNLLFFLITLKTILCKLHIFKTMLWCFLFVSMVYLSRIFISLASCHKSSKLVFKYTCMYLLSFFIDSPTLLLYMSSSFWLLRVESLDFSQADKERTACKAEQIHKMTTIFTQTKGPLSKNSCHFVNWQTIIYFSAWDKSRDLTANSQHLKDM